MTSTTKISECDLADACRKHLESEGLVVRAEVPVTLPMHGQVPADLLGYKAEAAGEWWTVVEVKRSFTPAVIEQAQRWVGHAHNVFVGAPTPKQWNSKHVGRLRAAASKGVGVLAIDGDHVMQVQGFPNIAANPALVSAAFHSHTGELDPPAGTAAGRRMTPERCHWEPLRLYLDNGQCRTPESRQWKFIKRVVRGMEAVTEAQARKAIHRGECVGVDYERNTIPTVFFATEGKTK